MEISQKKSGIRIKVLVGFSVAIVLVAVAAIINFTSANKLVSAVKNMSAPDQKLIALHQLENDLDDEERYVRAFALTQDTQYIFDYNSVLDTLHNRVANLKFLTMDETNQAAMAETISELVAAREGLLGRFIEKRKTSLSAALGKTSTGVQPIQYNTLTDTLHQAGEKENIPVVSNNIKATDSSISIPPETQKENKLANWFKNIFTTKKKEETPSSASGSTLESGEHDSSPAKSDQITIAQHRESQSINIQEIIAQQQNELKEQVQLWSLDELILLQQDKEVMDKIHAALNELQEDEMTFMHQQAEAANHSAGRANTAIIIIGIIGILTTLVFVYLILVDITRSNKLRMQLVDETNRAEKLTRAKEEFLANMSHEIRTPLNAISGFAEQLSKKHKPEEQQRFVRAIQQSSDHLVALVNEILDYSKLESGKQQRTQVPFDFHALINEVRETFSMKAEEKNIGLNYHFDADVPQFVEGDQLGAKQILINLVSNGIKFTEQGSVDIYCHAIAVGDALTNIRMEVKDTGIGISSSEKDKIFEEFFQSDLKLTNRYGGTGLGLAITRKLVSWMGGTIEVSSAEGKGSAFTVILPFKKITSIPAEQLQLFSSQTNTFQNKTVLIVDDEEMNLMLGQTILENWAVKTDVANSGNEALEKISDHGYDLILLDIQMPGMSGNEVARKIRALQDVSKNRVPIIALTANVYSAQLHEEAASGFNDVLIKPFKEKELFEKMKQAWELPPSEKHEVINNHSPSVDLKEEASFSLKYLQSTSGSNKEFIIKMLESFVNNSSNHLIQLNAALAERNWEAANTIAHKMIPSFRYLLITKTEKQLKKLEQITEREKDWNEAAGLVNQITRTTEQIIKSIEEEIQQMQTSGNPVYHS